MQIEVQLQNPVMAKLGHKVAFISAILVLMGLQVEGVFEGVVSVANFLNPPIATVTMHCIRDHDDMGVVALKSLEEFRFDIPKNFPEAYMCSFSAPTKRLTSFDVFHSKCNCDSYWGCRWLIRGDGFYCNHELLHAWAH